MENLHEIDIQIKTLLLTCQPTLLNLLEYFVKCRGAGDSSNVNIILIRIVRENFKLGGKIDDFVYANYEFSNEINISTLEISELGGLLLSEDLQLMKSVCCCEACDHKCLKCQQHSILTHQERVVCVKDYCSNCGSSAHECTYQHLRYAVTVMTNLYKSNKELLNSTQLYENFRMKNATIPEFPFCPTWPSLWRIVQSSLSYCCKFLNMKAHIQDDVWKDRNMDFRNALKKNKEQLLFLFGEQIKAKFPLLIAGTLGNREQNRDELGNPEPNRSVLGSREQNRNVRDGRGQYRDYESGGSSSSLLTSSKSVGEKSVRFSSSTSYESVGEGYVRPPSNTPAPVLMELCPTEPPENIPSEENPSSSSSSGELLGATAANFFSDDVQPTAHPGFRFSVPSETMDFENQPNYSFVAPSSRNPYDSFGTTVERDVSRRRLILMRGLPGSGKTTKAMQHVGASGIILSTDDYFMVDGQFVFDVDKIQDAHNHNQDRVTQEMIKHTSPIIVDNTNTKAWEMKPYVLLAKVHGYTTELMEASTDWAFKPKILSEKTSKSVKKSKIENMKRRYEKDVTLETILKSKKDF